MGIDPVDNATQPSFNWSLLCFLHHLHLCLPGILISITNLMVILSIDKGFGVVVWCGVDIGQGQDYSKIWEYLLMYNINKLPIPPAYHIIHWLSNWRWTGNDNQRLNYSGTGYDFQSSHSVSLEQSRNLVGFI